jgi:hypothetical protein
MSQIIDNKIETSETNEKLQKIEEMNDLKTRILELDNSEYIEIYKIFKKYNILHTKNNNGIFIDMNILSEECIKDIMKLLNYYDELKKKYKIDLNDNSIY